MIDQNGASPSVNNTNGNGAPSTNGGVPHSDSRDGSRTPTLNADEAKFRRVEELVSNVLMLREGIFRQLTDPRRSIEQECGYPALDEPISPDLFRSLYDRDQTANRVVQVLPKECWQVTPKIYEDEDSDTATPFEEAWDALEVGLDTGRSWHQDELGGTIWDRLLRADILSGIGHFGVLLLGIDDGRNLQDPVEGVVVFNREVIVRNIFGEERKMFHHDLPPDSPPTANEVKMLDEMIQSKTIQRTKHTQDKTGWHCDQETHQANFINDWRSSAAPEKKTTLIENADDGGFAPDGPDEFVPDPDVTENWHQAIDDHKPVASSSQETLGGAIKGVWLGTEFHHVVNHGSWASVDGDVASTNGMILNSSMLPLTANFKDIEEAWELAGRDGVSWMVGRLGNALFSAKPLTVATWNVLGSALLGRQIIVNDAWGDTSGDVGYGHGGPRRPTTQAKDSQGRTVEQIAAEQARQARSWGKDASASLSPEGTKGTDAQYAWQGAMPPAALSGTDQQYFGVYFGPSEAFPVDGGDQKREGKGGKSQPGTYAGNEPSGKKSKAPTRKLTFLRPFDESLVQIVRYEWNIRNPRFGMPVMYRITLNDPREQHSGVGLPLATVFVHWSRVIHLADNLGSSEIFGVPRQRPVLNRLLDLRKLYGASAEGYWKSAFTGFSFETNPQLGGDVIVDKQNILDMMEDFQNSLQRALITSGMTVKTLAPSVVDPASQIDAQITAICIQLAIPKRVFMGSERGELASSQDDSQWNDVKRARQLLYLTPKVLVPFIDRLIVLGILPEPESYSVEWPDLEALGDAAKAAILLQRTQAYAAYVGGNLEAVIPVQDYMTRFDDMEEEEAYEIMKAAQKVHEAQETMTMPPQVAGQDAEHAEGTQAKADQDQKQQQQAQQAQQKQQQFQQMQSQQQKQFEAKTAQTKTKPGLVTHSAVMSRLWKRRDDLQRRLTKLRSQVALHKLEEGCKK